MAHVKDLAWAIVGVCIWLLSEKDHPETHSASEDRSCCMNDSSQPHPLSHTPFSQPWTTHPHSSARISLKSSCSDFAESPKCARSPSSSVIWNQDVSYAHRIREACAGHTARYTLSTSFSRRCELHVKQILRKKRPKVKRSSMHACMEGVALKGF